MATGKSFKLLIYMCKVAEGQGFEPWDVLPSLVFKGKDYKLYIPKPLI